MRPRCTNHDAGADPPVLTGDEPVLAGPAHAASAIRLSAPPAEGPAVVVLLCDAEHRLVLAVVVDGATVGAATRVVELVLQVAEPAGVSGIIVGVVQPRLDQYLRKREAASLAGLIARCEAAGVHLLDLLLVGPRAWRSVHHLAAEPGGGKDGGP